MKRVIIVAAIITGLFWNASAVSAQYRPHTAHNPSMSGRNGTMSGRLQTNHYHLTPRPVTGYSPYAPGALISPAGGAPLGASLFPNLNTYNTPVYPAGGYSSLYGWNGWSYRR
jgi:hypothetical protein